MSSTTQMLSFISDEELLYYVGKVLNKMQDASLQGERELYKNVIDPFSALFDATYQGLSLTSWFEQEKSRQAQKTMQNSIGEFHQNILGSIAGWENLGTGNVVDLRNIEKRLVAEIKNKHNTTKGSEKKSIYESLKAVLDNGYDSYTAYYVEIIPPNRKRYDTPFTPSDNLTGGRKPLNERIRIIDGYSFYDLASGETDALRKLYSSLPTVICRLLGRPPDSFFADREFIDLFDRAY